jgi:[protein-PII] uridylyltransferase
MSDLFDNLDQRRTIIDRRALADRLEAIAAECSDSGACRRAMVALLKQALDNGRA